MPKISPPRQRRTENAGTWRIVYSMWLLHVLAAHLQWYGLLDVGLAMIDGSFYRQSFYQDNFDGGGDPNADFGGGD